MMQKRAAKTPHRLRTGISEDFGFKNPEMAIAPTAGPNAPMTPMSIRYVGFFMAATSGNSQIIHEQAKATIKNAVIGCFWIWSEQDARILIPAEQFTPVHLSFFTLFFFFALVFTGAINKCSYSIHEMGKSLMAILGKTKQFSLTKKIVDISNI
jgi:hypothetical protein